MDHNCCSHGSHKLCPSAASAGESAEPFTSSFLLPAPANLSTCLSSSYCHTSRCLLLSDPVTQESTSRVGCECFKPYADSEEGLCTARGRSKLIAFILRYVLLLLLASPSNVTSLASSSPSFYGGAFGVDWFYLSRVNTCWFLLGLEKLCLTLLWLIFYSSEVQAATSLKGFSLW